MAYKVYALLLLVVECLVALSAFARLIDTEMAVIVLAVAGAIGYAAEFLKKEGIIEKPKKR